MSTLKSNDRFYIPLIGGLSVIVPLVVAFLIFGNKAEKDIFGDVSFLPTLNAIINSTVSVLLVLGLVFIKRKQIKLHRFVMLSAFVLSALFLVSYIIYHYGADSVPYGGEGAAKVIYLIILGTHILLSVIVLPLAFFAIYRGLTDQIAKHKKITRWAWPIWLYVSITGVVVYLMAHVYNPSPIDIPL